jgi:hypothetical protein
VRDNNVESPFTEAIYNGLWLTFLQVSEPGKNALIIPLEEYARGMNISPTTLRKAIVKLHDDKRIVAHKVSYPIYVPEHWEISFVTPSGEEASTKS